MADVILQAEVVKDSENYKHVTAVEVLAGLALLVTGTFAAVVTPEPPASLIYSTADAAGGGTGFEAVSSIPAAALPGALASVYVTLANAAEAPFNPTSYWIQFHLGGAPGLGAIPLLVGDSIVTPGGNEQFIPPDEIDRVAGFTVVASTTQMTFTPPVGPPTTVLRTRAWGRV